MRRPAPHETVGLVLLGLALFSLALALHQAQPGLANGSSPWAWPAGVGVVYVLVAILATRARIARAAMLLVALLVCHVLYALLMGLAFAVQSQTPGGLSPAPLVMGLSAYPPAVLLQAAFVIPLSCALFGVRPSVADAAQSGVEVGGEDA